MDHRLKCKPKAKQCLEEKHTGNYLGPCIWERLLRFDL